ncbi:lipopolysaccharide modification acyltransferase [Janibacter sp. Soil728]|uniref:acyltransferase family protein n=1 Tax=Janibacter sp. Soil728 TaxID=1736393 RepID=UPI0006FD0135|nr:acyltransferase family protein [Janibacter sp. Soil728]KRE38514.1 lipopolysaccharide modification acyltransferase [Janibacter sp. Soil728]
MGQPTATADIEVTSKPAAATPDASTTRARRTPRGHLAGLDGLRALAVIAVVIFHLDPSWLPGGFLGVDVFFVISGFLITTLLVRERRESGRVDLRGFWTRRARRLLPALLVVVPAAILIARTVEADLLVGVRRQALGALTFSTNWLEIAQGSNYFAASSPQLFMNFWSLAVEEQFYLFWPLVMLGLLALHRRFALTEGVLATIVLGVGVASAVSMALTYDATNATRAYYGTDTHLFGLMLGAALAIVWTGPLRAYTTSPRWCTHRRWFVGGAMATIVALFVLAGEEHAWTFALGIPLVSVATAVLLLAAVERPGRLRAVLELPPLAWIGQRSYGIYLWHWPVILIVAQDIPTNAGTSAFVWTRVWAIVVTLAVADLSFRFVETPVRRLGFRKTGRRILGAFALLHSVRTRRIVLGGAVTAALVLGVVLVTAPDTTTTQRTIEQNQARAAAPRKTEPAPTFSGTASFTMPTGNQIDVFGDSMVVGSVPALEYYFPGIQIDARSNRRWSDGLAAVDAAGTSLRRAVVLAFGTNAGTDPETVEKILAEIGDDHMVVIVNLHADRLSRIDDDNAALKKIAAKHPNVALADWDSAVDASDLQADGIHPSLGGAHTYAATIRQAFADLSKKHTGKTVTLKELPRP